MNPTVVEAPDAPFLRPPDTSASLPNGWVSEPAGRWTGAPMNVAYDPRRHNVMFTRTAVNATVTDGLQRAGWVRQAGDGTNEMWVRDRLAATRAALDRAGRSAGVEIGGRGL